MQRLQIRTRNFNKALDGKLSHLRSFDVVR